MLLRPVGLVLLDLSSRPKKIPEQWTWRCSSPASRAIWLGMADSCWPKPWTADGSTLAALPGHVWNGPAVMYFCCFWFDLYFFVKGLRVMYALTVVHVSRKYRKMNNLFLAEIYGSLSLDSYLMHRKVWGIKGVLGAWKGSRTPKQDIHLCVAVVCCFSSFSLFFVLVQKPHCECKNEQRPPHHIPMRLTHLFHSHSALLLYKTDFSCHGFSSSEFSDYVSIVYKVESMC